jgi:iron complex outermembrane receptor protein
VSALTMSAAVGQQAAEQGAEAPTHTELAEVTVTAERQEESLQRVPVAVTAITEQDLTTRHIDDIRALTSAAPAMNVTTLPSNSSALLISMRGVSANNPTLVQDPTTGIYLDGVYIARAPGGNLDLVDVQRVEVLRGPQGTLFGRNSIGGAINITSNTPKNDWEGSASAEFGDYNTKLYTGILNAPLIDDRLSARLAVRSAQHSGYQRDVFLGQDLNDESELYLRGSVLFKITSDWQLLAVFDRTRDASDSRSARFSYISPKSPYNAGLPAAAGNPADRLSNYLLQSSNFYDSYGDINPRNHLDVWGGNVTLTGVMGPVTFKSISAFRDLHLQQPLDSDGTPYSFLELPSQPYASRQLTQEFQLFGNAVDDRLNWLSGLYYSKERGAEGQTLIALYPLSPNQTFYTDTVDNSSYAAYLHGRFKLTSLFELFAGVRYNRDTREVAYVRNVTNLKTSAVTCVLPASLLDAPGDCTATLPQAAFHFIPFEAGVNFTPVDDTLIYAKVSRGFRSGGFPPCCQPTAASFVPFSPDRLTSYEVGSKLDLFEHRLRLNDAVYYSKYADIQQSTARDTGTGPANIVGNFGSGEIRGGELEATALLNHLKLGASVGIVSATFTEGPFVDKPFINAPKTTAAGSADYDIAVPVGTVDLFANYSWRSRVWSQTPPTQLDPVGAQYLAQKPYGLLDLRVSLELNRLPLTFALWGRNVTGVKYNDISVDLISSNLGAILAYPGNPRTYGGTVTYTFGPK